MSLKMILCTPRELKNEQKRLRKREKLRRELYKKFWREEWKEIENLVIFTVFENVVYSSFAK